LSHKDWKHKEIISYTRPPTRSRSRIFFTRAQNSKIEIVSHQFCGIYLKVQEMWLTLN